MRKGSAKMVKEYYNKFNAEHVHYPMFGTILLPEYGRSAILSNVMHSVLRVDSTVCVSISSDSSLCNAVIAHDKVSQKSKVYLHGCIYFESKAVYLPKPNISNGHAKCSICNLAVCMYSCPWNRTNTNFI